MIPLPPQQDWRRSKRYVCLSSGTKLAYLRGGNESGQLLLLIHGFTDSSRSWSQIAPYLSGFNLVMVDLHGHGDSSQSIPAFCLSAVAADIDEFMGKLGVSSAIVVGHSLGSMVAGVLTVFYPQRVEKLVLIATATAVPEACLRELEDVVATPTALDPDGDFVTQWFANPTAVDDEFLRLQRHQCVEMPESTWRAIVRSLCITDWSYVATGIRRSTMILWGDEDPIFGEDTQARVRSLIPAAKFIAYGGHGHNMFWECPIDVARDITRFIEFDV